MSLRASSSVLGLHFLRQKTIESNKNFRKKIPKTLQNKGDGITSLQEDTRCVSVTTFTSHIFLVSLLLFCVKGPVSTNNWFPRHGSNWESTTRKAEDCGALWLSNSRAEPKWPTTWGNSETRSKQTSDPHRWQFSKISIKNVKDAVIRNELHNSQTFEVHRSYWTTRTKLTRPWTFVISNLDSVTSSCCCSRIANSSRSCSLSSCQLNLHKK